METTARFDTAAYEEGLAEGGVDPQHAKAHRVQLALVLKQVTSTLATTQDITMVETRLESKIDKAVQDLTWRVLGGVGVMIGIATAIIKLA